MKSVLVTSDSGQLVDTIKEIRGDYFIYFMFIDSELLKDYDVIYSFFKETRPDYVIPVNCDENVFVISNLLGIELKIITEIGEEFLRTLLSEL